MNINFEPEETERAVELIERLCDEYEADNVDASAIRYLLLAVKLNPFRMQ